ncbi:DUF3883 domain-containing protein [Pseudogemmobacter blasticus]|uniref:Protein NO VEIN C-terminal domain-containing protein n=1 Tax=Fuscovulum blasticum DSM 2131 TaxID=1188250 RepID=A0A2T4J5X7_FUSBL|nr:DUF3883 domain-containing protein [Fuscovulum blasticum]PTE13265.1 hypothetical protein C5F44_14635 [Fuscovulum blasticum DSM 2131]
MAQEAWSDLENEAIVADYFAMLAAELADRPYSKAAHRRALQPLLAGRSEAAIEFKHQNISAVLMGLGAPRIAGYLPAQNFQAALAGPVNHWLERHPDFAAPATGTAAAGVSEVAPLPFDTPPTLRNEPAPAFAEKLRAIALRFDVAARDDRNRSLGRAGEERVLAHERETLRRAGRHDLARRIVWVSQERGDGAGYDIASFTPEGAERLIEVKTTNGAWDRTPFHISANELRVADERRADWRLVRVFNFARSPRAFELRPPLSAHVALTATSFRADFG